jgi:hypothetical protein
MLTLAVNPGPGCSRMSRSGRRGTTVSGRRPVSMVTGARVDGREGTPGSANAGNEPERCRPVPDGAA